MSNDIPEEFHYRLHWRARSAQLGGHPTRTAGGSADFRSFVPFLQNPDPRRIDLRASLRSTPRNLMVRTFYERGAITVYAVVDLSASMRFSGNAEKMTIAADIAASVACSATRSGDAFGLVACDDTVRIDLHESPTFRRGIANEVRQKLLQSETRPGVKASGLRLAAEHLRRRRSLVFLISDFHLDTSLLADVLTAMAPHDVVPIVLWDSAEYSDLPNWGWARVRDMEGGGEQSLFLRPVLAERIRIAYGERRLALAAMCRNMGTRPPFFLKDHFNVEHLTRHMMETC